MKAPLVDGGEGFSESLVAATGGSLVKCEVTGPVGAPVASHFGFLGGERPKTAVMEMAAAAGLSLVPRDMRHPLHTTSFGVGELIKLALDAGAEEILFGCGDSGTCDGGVGMAQALGVRFLDSDGQELPQAVGGLGLLDLATVDVSGLDPRLENVSIDVACNWHNILCGPKGVARVFGPQKGASPDEVELLDLSMHKVAGVVSGVLGQDISHTPGGGASGGLGAGLLLIGAKLHPRFDIVTQFLNIESLLADTDLVITAEGGIDYQTPNGKVPVFLANLASRYNVPVITLAGTVGAGAALNYEHGIAAFASICSSPMPLETAIADAKRLLTDAAEMTTRMMMVGWNVCRSVSPVGEPRSRSNSRSGSRSRRGSMEVGSRRASSPPGLQTQKRESSQFLTIPALS